MRELSMKETGAKKSSMKAWGALAAASLVYACANGVMANCLGVVFAAIIGDMGFKASQMSLFHSIRSVMMSLAVGSMGGVFMKCKNPKAYMVATGLATSAAFAAMSFYNAIWQWYISAIIAGICMSTISIMVPVVINNWFKVKQGTLMGIAFMGSGVTGALLSPIFSGIIETSGWRSTCLIIGAFGILLWVLPCLLLFGRDPKETGDIAYGETESTQGNASDGEADAAKMAGGNDKSETSSCDSGSRTAGSGIPASVFFMLVIAVAPVTTLISMINQLATFATTLGYELSVGAMITSCSMIGNLGGKLISGAIADKFGALKMLSAFSALVGIGLVMILMGAASPALLCAGALFLGGSFSVGAPGSALIFKEIYGEEYADKLKSYTFISGIVGTATGFLFPLVYDITGSWKPVFVYGIAVCAVSVGIYARIKRHIKPAV